MAAARMTHGTCTIYTFRLCSMRTITLAHYHDNIEFLLTKIHNFIVSYFSLLCFITLYFRIFSAFSLFRPLRTVCPVVKTVERWCFFLYEFSGERF